MERIHTVLFPSWTAHCSHVHLPRTTSKAGKKPLWRLFQSVKKLSLVWYRASFMTFWDYLIVKKKNSEVLSWVDSALKVWSFGLSEATRSPNTVVSIPSGLFAPWQDWPFRYFYTKITDSHRSRNESLATLMYLSICMMGKLFSRYNYGGNGIKCIMLY